MATQENTTADVSVFVTPNVQRDVCTPDGYKNYTELVSLKNALSIVLNSYYNFLYNFDKQLIGNKIPSDNFYYIEK